MESNRRHRELRTRRLQQRCNLAAADSQTTRSHSFLYIHYRRCAPVRSYVSHTHIAIYTPRRHTSLHTKEAYLLHVHWGARQKQKLQLRRRQHRRRRSRRRLAREVGFFLVFVFCTHTYMHTYKYMHAYIHAFRSGVF